MTLAPSKSPSGAGTVAEQILTPTPSTPAPDKPEAGAAAPHTQPQTSPKTPSLANTPPAKTSAPKTVINWQLPSDLSVPTPIEHPSTTGTTDGEIFDPRLRRSVLETRQVQEQQRAAVRTDISTHALSGEGRRYIRAGDHCFIHQAADPLDEDSFETWSPVRCVTDNRR
ncbi:hypothetical protein [Bacterioplanes sanyensis]|uniref:hypothetical protein n=1 Tax=Bacterioplanes sanyensis TaxID=1249553 RepID=UPI0012FD2BF3|nr:hypothetical protein [Bacterioplanes sanyensis]